MKSLILISILFLLSSSANAVEESIVFGTGVDFGIKFMRRDRDLLAQPINAYDKGVELRKFHEIYGANIERVEGIQVKHIFNIGPRGFAILQDDTVAELLVNADIDPARRTLTSQLNYSIVRLGDGISGPIRAIEVKYSNIYVFDDDRPLSDVIVRYHKLKVSLAKLVDTEDCLVTAGCIGR